MLLYFSFVRVCSTSPPSGNQVDGLPPAPVTVEQTYGHYARSNTGEEWFGRESSSRIGIPFVEFFFCYKLNFTLTFAVNRDLSIAR